MTMMTRFILILLMALWANPAQAITLLSEDFEGSSAAACAPATPEPPPPPLPLPPPVLQSGGLQPLLDDELL